MTFLIDCGAYMWKAHVWFTFASLTVLTNLRSLILLLLLLKWIPIATISLHRSSIFMVRPIS